MTSRRDEVVAAALRLAAATWYARAPYARASSADVFANLDLANQLFDEALIRYQLEDDAR